MRIAIPYDNENVNAAYSANSDFRISDVVVEKASMTVSRISLMRSDRGKHGMIYTELGCIAAE